MELLIITVGIIFLGNNLNLWNIEIFFDGWWTLFIIIPSLIGLLKRETFIPSLLGLSVRVLLLLAAQKIIMWYMVGKVFIPIILIVVGLSMIFQPNISKKVNNKGLPEYIGVFSGI